MTDIKAVLWDFGGVIHSSPFDKFAEYERAHGLPKDFIRGINATNPDTNAWAKFERNEVSMAEFCALFEAEAEAAGHRIVATDLMGLLAGELWPAMVEALRRCHERLKNALITNNFFMSEGHVDRENPMTEVLSYFDVVIESSKSGVRKPDPRVYEMACDELGVSPDECVFLDDLGVNLKPARAMGITTIKVIDPAQAIQDLERAVGFPLT